MVTQPPPWAACSNVRPLMQWVSGAVGMYHYLTVSCYGHGVTSKSSSLLEELAHLCFRYSVANKYFFLEMLVCIFLSLFVSEIRCSRELPKSILC